VTVEELADLVGRGGGILRLDGERVRYWLPADISNLAPELIIRKPELIALLRREGGQIGSYLWLASASCETAPRKEGREVLTLEAMVSIIERGGGTLWLDGDEMKAFASDTAHHILSVLLVYEDDLMDILQSCELKDLVKRSGGRLGCVPICPKCASNRLYKKRIEQDFQCLDCGERDINKNDTQRVM
jgi:hypothetical protein